MSYLGSFYNGRTVGTYFGGPEIHGRLFYNDALTDLNFGVRRAAMDEVLRDIRAHRDEEQPPTLYIGSTTIDACLPGLRQHNDIPFRNHSLDPLASIWIGNRTLVSCHHDAPNNLACCVVGRRRFTVFPPEQIVNLYPGPLDPTPGGQAISMVDFANPDFEKYPRFREALGGGPGRRDGTGRRDLSPEPVVASGAVAEPVQRAHQLLVERCAAVHGHAHERSASRAR